jgi:hypothetical protein
VPSTHFTWVCKEIYFLARFNPFCAFGTLWNTERCSTSISQVLTPGCLRYTQHNIRVFTPEISTVYIFISDLSVFWHHLMYGKPYKLRARIQIPHNRPWFIRRFRFATSTRLPFACSPYISLRGKGCVPLFWNNPYGVYCAWFLPSILQQ